MTVAGPPRAVPATNGTPRGRPGRPAGRPPLSRTEILAAAALVFRRDGYQSARMEDVAEVLGITKPSLYYYVRTKHELLFDIILPPYRDAVAHLDEVLASSSPTPVRIGEVVARHLGNVARYSPAISIYVENLRSLPIPPEMSELDARYVRGLRQLMAAGLSDGSLRSCDPSVAADALLGMCNRFAVRHSPHTPFDPDVLAATVTSIFLNGVTRPGTGTSRRRKRVDGHG
jgi:AcrR family transcriptional regulator